MKQNFTLIFFLLFTACAVNEIDHSEESLPEVEARWFTGPSKFITRTRERERPIHPFFDFKAELNHRESTINYVPLTLKDSLYKYDLDLHSGKIYKKYPFCSQQDIWDRYPSSFDYPPYHEGIIPRLLDQLGKPQRIRVFGGEHNRENGVNSSLKTTNVRVVGGVVEQYCEEYPCVNNNRWTSRLILIATNTSDETFGLVKTMPELRKKVNWDYIKAFMENGNGITFRGDEKSPAFRITKSINARKVLKYVTKSGYVFGGEELNTLRNSCYKLYDYIWEKYKYFKENGVLLRKVLKKRKRNKDIVQNLRENKFVSAERKDEFVESFDEFEFSDYFKVFDQKHSKRFKTCYKYVKFSNIEDDKDRHWFFSYLQAYYLLNDLGKIFYCPKNTWVDNPFITENRRRFSHQKLLARCTGKTLDRGFDHAITKFFGLRSSGRPYYRYIEYDSGIGGSHDPIYSWVRDNNKRLSCSVSPKKDKNLLFPKDIEWWPIHFKKKGTEQKNK